LCNTYGDALSDSLYGECLDQGRTSRVYSMVDGSMIFTREGGWKEVKLGRVFEQRDHLAIDSKGRNWIKNSQYVAHLGDLRGFLDKMETVIPTQSELVFIADGAKWIWNWIESIYPEAVQILDFYHAKEHACEFAALQFKEEQARNQWIDQAQDWLMDDQLDLLIEEINQLKPINQLAAKAREKLLGYYWNHYHRMQYQSFQEKGLLIGSGPIESAHRTVIQKRLKRSGQRWIRANAQKVCNLRVANLSNKWKLMIDLVKQNAA
jgi:hypothetical protein